MSNQQCDKYKEKGDYHWQEWANDGEYTNLVKETIYPFFSVTPGRLVNIGCGDGMPLSLLNKAGHKCVGVDISETGIKLALGHDVPAEYFIESAERFEERGFSFDYLYCLNTIEHLSDPDCIVRLMHRVRNFSIVVTNAVEFFEQLPAEFKVERIALSSTDHFACKISRK